MQFSWDFCLQLNSDRAQREDLETDSAVRNEGEDAATGTTGESTEAKPITMTQIVQLIADMHTLCKWVRIPLGSLDSRVCRSCATQQQKGGIIIWKIPEKPCAFCFRFLFSTKGK